MKIGYMSDLHLHWNKDGEAFTMSLLSDVDLQIIAGDVCDGTTDLEPLARLVHHFGKTPVVFVPGNHEHFFSDPSETEERLRALEAAHPNLRVLLGEDMQVPNGPRIVGTTMWYRATPEMSWRHSTWADFRFIKRLVEHTNDRFLHDNALLESVRPNDIVVTHMLPSWACVATMWQNARTNELFVRNAEPIIYDNKPSFWVHGHTHTQVNKMLGQTQILCNPRGTTHDSRGVERAQPENPDFDPRARFEWQP